MDVRCREEAVTGIATGTERVERDLRVTSVHAELAIGPRGKGEPSLLRSSETVVDDLGTVRLRVGREAKTA